jgi:hypothetical protein
MSFDFVIPTAADWPYTLPPAVTCRQGEHVVTVATAFTPPATSYWFAADGTLVLPRRRGTGAGAAYDAPPGVLGAAIEPAVPGLSCSARDGTLEWDVDPEETAGGVCRLQLGDGSVKEQRVVVLGY